MVVINFRVPRLAVQIFFLWLRLHGRIRLLLHWWWRLRWLHWWWRLRWRCRLADLSIYRWLVIIDFFDDWAVDRWYRTSTQINETTASSDRRVVSDLLLLGHCTPSANLSVRSSCQVLRARQDRQAPKSKPHAMTTFMTNDPR
jgi:hypothetical protein